MRTLAIALLLALPALIVLAPPVPAQASASAWEIDLLYPPVAATNPHARVFYRDIAFHPGGDYALVVGGIRGLPQDPCGGWSFVMSYDGAKFEVLLNETGCLLSKAAWHPDGSHAIIVGERDTILKFNAADKSFTNVWAASEFALAGEHFLPRSVAYRPDGEYALISGNDLLRFYPVVPGTEARDVLAPGAHGQGTFYDSVAWSPDSKYAILEAGITDKEGTRALGAVAFFQTDSAKCAAKGASTTPCIYTRTLYGRNDPGFTDIDDITFGPIGRVAWIYGLDGGQGTLLRYGEAEDAFSYPYAYAHTSGRLSSMAWQPNAYKVLYTGYGNDQLVLSESWRFTTLLTNDLCAERWPDWLQSGCPNLKEAAWHPSGEWALIIGGTGWAFKFRPHLTPTVQIGSPSDGADLAGSSHLVRGLALPQQTTRKISEVQVRLDDGAWQTANLGAHSSTGTPWNLTLPLDALEPGTRHTIEARASDDNGTSWGAPASIRFYVRDTTRSYHRLTLEVTEGAEVANGFNLTWDAAGDASYVVQRSREPTFVSAETLYAQDAKLTFPWHQKGTWYFRVAAKGGLNQGDWSNIVTVKVTTGPDRASGYDAGEIVPNFDDEDDGPLPVVNNSTSQPKVTDTTPPPRRSWAIPGVEVALLAAGAAVVALARRRE